MQIGIRNTAFCLANLRICDLRSGTRKFTDLRINHYKFMDLQTGTPQNFADLQLRNEPKNLWICDLRTNKNNLRAHLAQYI